jgi:hypothetical protein
VRSRSHGSSGDRQGLIGTWAAFTCTQRVASFAVTGKLGHRSHSLRTSTLLKIPAGLSAIDHLRAAEKIARDGLDGLELSCYGGAFGPVWKTDEDYDLACLRHYPGIRRLRLGIRVRSLDGLEALAPSLEDLLLMQPPCREYKISLSPLASCQRLATFASAWRGLDLRPVEQLPALTTLRLTGAGADGFALACGLPRLLKLHLSFVAIRRLDGLQNLTQLEHLSVSRIRGLAGLPEVAHLRLLRRVELDCLARVQALPDFGVHEQLDTLICSTMKGLQDLDGLRGSRLRELALIDVGTPIDALARVRRELPQLERVVLHLGGRRQTEAAKDLFDPKMVAASTNELALFHEHGVREEIVAFS